MNAKMPTDQNAQYRELALKALRLLLVRGAKTDAAYILSEVAVCCSNASLSSRRSRTTSVSWSGAERLRRRTVGACRRFGISTLPRPLTGFLLPLERRRIAAPKAQEHADTS
jgi:hypothetical protein